MTESPPAYLIDTDWLVDFLAGRRRAVALFERLGEEKRAISIVTYGEGYEGIYFGARGDDYESIFSKALLSLAVLGVSEPIARRFARIRGELRKRGALIPDGDLLIAATAVGHGLTLVTRNRRHFERVPGLRLYLG